jgi:putative addiction module component (TIGR02574 family)
MNEQAESLLKEGLSLPDSNRADMAGALLESLEPSSDTEVEEAWKQEVAARIAALVAGEVELVPWETVRDRLWARLSEHRSV